MQRDIIAGLGLDRRLASVRSIPLTGAEIVADQGKAIASLAELSERCVKEDGADCVIDSVRLSDALDKVLKQN